MRDKVLYVLATVAIVILVWNIYTIARLPEETQQGVVFKIIFFHVPMWAAAFCAAGAALIGSVLFLITRNFKYDALAVAATETGLAFVVTGLVTGSIWGRQIWGIWWAWDPRLTSALVCGLLYAGYLMLRRAVEEPTQRATFAAVFSIFAFIDVPIVIFSIKWWRTQHPAPVFWSGGYFPPDWTVHFRWNMLAMVLFGIVITAVRLRQEEFHRELDSIRREAHAI